MRSLPPAGGGDTETETGEVTELVGPDAPLLTSPQHVDCDHSASSSRVPLSTHRTSAGTVGYLRCRCGAWLVLQEGELLAVVAMDAFTDPMGET